jgi:cytochrome c-type biogenesis protein CcmH
MRSATRRLPRAVAAVLAASALLPSAALAQCPQTSLRDIEDEVLCPVCGTPLALATDAPQAQRQREFILERIERCDSKEEIEAALVAQFGEGVLATPEDEGFDLVAYLLPALAVIAGAAAIVLATLRWRRGRRRTLEEPPGPSRTERERLDADLGRYDL